MTPPRSRRIVGRVDCARTTRVRARTDLEEFSMIFVNLMEPQAAADGPEAYVAGPDPVPGS